MNACIATLLVLAAQPLNVAILHVDGLTQDGPSFIDGNYTPVDVDSIARLDPDTLLVLPQPQSFPAVGISFIEAFIGKGGHLLAVGGPPFQTLVYQRSDGAWVDLEDLLAEVKPEHPLVDWDAVNAAPPRRGSGRSPAKATYTPLPNGYTADLDMPEAASWEVREIPVQTPPPPGDDVLRLRVSGQAPPKTLLVEVRETDGSRWMTKVALTSEPREVGIHRNAFAFWHDGSPPNRGFKGDMPDFSKLAALQVGFAASHQRLDAGHYTYTIEGVATGRCGAEVVMANPPRLEGLSPSYKLFSATAARTQWLGPFAGHLLDVPAAIVSPIARPMHDGAERDYVWQPHAKAFKDTGQWIATPLSTTWHNSGATWSFLGWQPKPDELAAIVTRLASVLADGKPDLPAPALEDDPSQGPTVSVADGRFMLDGKPWFANGINFWPLYVSGMEPPEYYSHWLNSSDYIPELVEQDLAILEAVGVNLVSIQYERVEEVPQLHDLLARCGRHGIKVNIFLRGAHPIHPDASDDLSQRPYLELMRAANLRGNPHVFAYDLAWEPRLGLFDERQRLDPLFEAWVKTQYESIEHAEEVWQCPANRSDGKLTGPTNDQLRIDGPHRVMVAAYRRFADDLISRRYGEVVRLAREIDDTHLFGARTGYGGTGTRGVVAIMPFQLTSGAAHLDFLSPEGYGYGPDNIADAALVTAYARWAGNGKPVFWAEFGYSVLGGGSEALQTQAELYGAFADMIARSDADGWAGWWYPGGRRVDERSDFGIVAPDSVPRPATQHLHALADRAAALSGYVTSGQLLSVQRDGSSNGLTGVIERNSDTFSKFYREGNIPSIVTPGTGTTSLICPYTGIGGVPYEAPGPPEYLNAELWVEHTEGGTIRVHVLNTGEAQWVPDDCVLVLEGRTEPQLVSIPAPIDRFQQFDHEISAPLPDRVFMQSKRFGAFGKRAVPGGNGPQNVE